MPELIRITTGDQEMTFDHRMAAASYLMGLLQSLRRGTSADIEVHLDDGLDTTWTVERREDGLTVSGDEGGIINLVRNRIDAQWAERNLERSDR